MISKHVHLSFLRLMFLSLNSNELDLCSCMLFFTTQQEEEQPIYKKKLFQPH